MRLRGPATALVFTLVLGGAPAHGGVLPISRPAGPLVTAAQAPPAVADAVGGLRNLVINIDSVPPEHQYAPAVAASVLHAGVAVATFGDTYGTGMQVSRTVDGGRHWFAQRLPLINSSDVFGTCFGFDPEVAYSRRDDAFYVVVGCAQLDNGLIELHVVKSVDDGLTWTSAYRAAVVWRNHQGTLASLDPSYGAYNPAIAVDNTPTSPYYGRIYVGFTLYHAAADGSATCPGHIAYSDDLPTENPGSGQWVDRELRGSDRSRSGVGGFSMTVDDQGGLDVLYADESCSSFRDYGVRFVRSTDGGASYGRNHKITRPAFFRDNPDPNHTLPNRGAFPELLSPNLVFNPATGTLHAVYGDFHDNRTSGGDIEYQRSTDYGRTWSAGRPISTGPDGLGAPNDQWDPGLTVDPTTGDLHALWLDSRNDPQNILTETFQAFSGDDGMTWSSTDISTRSWDPRTGWPGGIWGGSYTGFQTEIAAYANRIYPVWSDSRNIGPVPPAFGGADIFTNVEPSGSPAAP